MTSPFIQPEPGFYVLPSYSRILAETGLDSLETVICCKKGQMLSKSSLAAWRHRIRLQLANGQTAYLKRYISPPFFVQLKAWIQHRHRALLAEYDKGPSEELTRAAVLTPQVIAYGGRWNGWSEKCSFIMTLEIPHGRSLEQKLPDCFETSPAPMQRQAKNECICRLADFVRRFHATGYRHQDLYLSHLFLSDEQILYLIDLHRTFKPRMRSRYYQVKDIAQLHYSSPAAKISRSDRLRFFRAYVQREKLTAQDKELLRQVHSKALCMARHNRKHGRICPFQEKDA
ncbi:MAG TPA: lipopolysaccharide kinase InaA family protein [Anaerohalosphaeraceae bacterium]|nr:lipopolysaccharide kinase InaA family protein [Anaerohalosphaeraceae bacterium]HOL31720.1 lipopolysaccharide kinase InaA family protein [Anaerohalosphaeraceae bacterium]HOM75372.1 lipopolysaccharide kinase InaA family protein [Anaerohalosphaeraceae bacterium]HPC64252.1 lipopolysaccharide kinase InaA family protein [Anaerohalosphaeraceae bacterium]HPO69356.1 lipopolysaccharide kinase InaA family protein [Anaerohalosphaeraceae bacterium]